MVRLEELAQMKDTITSSEVETACSIVPPQPLLFVIKLLYYAVIHFLVHVLQTKVVLERLYKKSFYGII
jgi:hypothetical protein